MIHAMAPQQFEVKSHEASTESLDWLKGTFYRKHSDLIRKTMVRSYLSSSHWLVYQSMPPHIQQPLLAV